jgi:hypothetical protein
MHIFPQSKQPRTFNVVPQTISNITAAKETRINVVGPSHSTGGGPRIHPSLNDLHDITWIKRLESRDARIELNAVPVEYRRLKKSTDAFFHVLLEVKVIVRVHKHIVGKLL